MSFEDSITDFSSRRFSGYICLRAQVGDDLDKVYGRTAVNNVWKRWAVHRHAQKKPTVGIMVGYTQESLSSIESNDDFEFVEDPWVKIQGDLHASNDDLNDEEIIETLKSLFCHIAKALKQTQVEFKYYGEEKYLCRYNIAYPPKRT